MRAPAFLFLGDLVIVARQARLITEARRRGYAPLLVVTPHTDPARLAELRADPSHPLSQLADVVEVPDATVDAVMPGIQPLLRRYDVQGTMCIGDLFVEPTGVVADVLGLPGAGSGASRISRNKLLQRTALPEYSPDWRVVTPAERADVDPAEISFPVVVKPIGRFSSLGVYQVDDGERLAEVLAGYPADEIVLIESRVVGPEFSVESLVQHGKVFWNAVTAKETNESSGSFFTEMGHTCPAELAVSDEDLLFAANAEVLRRLDFRDGIAHAEFRISEGRAVLMEVAVRVPGGGITFLWHLATGEPLEPVMLDLALGQPADYPAPRRRARQVYLDHPHGVLVDVTSTSAPVSWVERDDRYPAMAPVAANAPAGARAVFVTQQPGAVLGAQTDGEQRSGSVLFDVPFGSPAEPLAEWFAGEVTVHVVSER
ncbi:Biotin carboxylase [Amycolatopsis xylanica]|uniref:Biotin carboxylase n=1 Tax=Amycolatopsis xylanica TaxID=589385 RepID=A0A1H3K7U2_9PSEU|nr:ATP-grasp domain-containing protein [Amycolatopsis xylanica]SDY48277.1 Biotin carboxylase [Amycolatopsis xylanica]